MAAFSIWRLLLDLEHWHLSLCLCWSLGKHGHAGWGLSLGKHGHTGWGLSLGRLGHTGWGLSLGRLGHTFGGIVASGFVGGMVDNWSYVFVKYLLLVVCLKSNRVYGVLLSICHHFKGVYVW